MASVPLFVFFFLSHLVLLHSAEAEEKRKWPDCLPLFQCGKFGTIGFPFINSSHPSRCGLLPVNCDGTPPTIQLPVGLSVKPYEVINISYTDSRQSIRIKDFSLFKYFLTDKCEYLTDFTLPNSPLISFKLTTPIKTLFKCNRILDDTSPRDFKYRSCGDYNIYYSSPRFASQCSIIQTPVIENAVKDEVNLTAVYSLEIHVSDACSSCYSREGLCRLDHKGKFRCAIAKKGIDIGILQNILVLQLHTYIENDY